MQVLSVSPDANPGVKIKRAFGFKMIYSRLAPGNGDQVFSKIAKGFEG